VVAAHVRHIVDRRIAQSQEASVELSGGLPDRNVVIPASATDKGIGAVRLGESVTASEGDHMTTVNASKLLLTPNEAAEQLAVSRTKVYELMAAGTLRSIHIGRLRRVPVDALRDFIGEMELR